MFGRIIAMALLICSATESKGLKALWQNGVGVTDESYQRFRELYASPDGFIQWKADGEWLMSDEFMADFIAEGCDPNSRSFNLKRYWVGEGLGTAGFDNVLDSEWPEENRDAAIPFVKTMIAFYRAYIPQIPDGPVKTELVNTIENLKRLESYFQYITNLDDVEESFKKEQYK